MLEEFDSEVVAGMGSGQSYRCCLQVHWHPLTVLMQGNLEAGVSFSLAAAAAPAPAPPPPHRHRHHQHHRHRHRHHKHHHHHKH